jgi:hypothetical protein
VSYRGFAPVEHFDSAEMRAFFEELDALAAHPSSNVEPALELTKHLPSLNELSRLPVTLFAKNYHAAWFFAVVYVVYMMWRAISSEGDRISRDRLPRIIHALGAYLAVGSCFALLYFNASVNDLAKQNLLLLYAESLDPTSKTVDVPLSNRGWNGFMAQQLAQLRETHGPNEEVTKLLDRARTHYWSSSSLAQELPERTVKASQDETGSARTEEPQPTSGTTRGVYSSTDARTEMTLVADNTLLDTIYFSFATFTTTGYGDIRPVSDEMRCWAIIENIAELLFTAIFFAIALQPGTQARSST